MSDTTPHTPPAAPTPAPPGGNTAPSPRKRRRRLALIAVCTFLLLWLGVTQSGVLARFVVPMVRAALPCDVTCGRVTMDPLGRITIRDVRLSVPSLTGPAAEFLAAPYVTATLDWGSVFSGSARIGSIELHAPVTRLSVAPDQTLNVASLRSAGGAGGGQIPQLILTRAKFELGEHDPDSGAYDELFTLRVEGAMRAHPDTANFYSINLSEILPRVERQHRTPTSIDGWIDVSTIEGAITVHDVDLASWSERAAPRAVRDLWEQMAMRGRIEDARFAFSSKELLEAAFALSDVDMRIPLQYEAASDESAAPGLVSMTGVSGSLRFDPGGFEGDIAGQIEDLTCHVTIRTDGLALDAPLVCNIRAADFIVAEHPQLMPFAPHYVERIFRRFSGPTAHVSGVVRVERGPPIDATPSKLDIAGAFTFEHGQASYEHFPYPFHNMRGTINFDAESIDLVHISARGPSGSSLLASGWIAPPREGAAVDLNITVADVPIDESFFAAMPERRAQVLESVFNRTAYQHMLDSGLLMTKSDREHLLDLHRDADLHLRMTERDNPGDTESKELALARIASIDEQLETPVFDLGGNAALFIRVLREFGKETDYETSIGIHIEDAGIVADAFPYPVSAPNARIQIDDTTAHIAAPAISSPTGASGSLVGSVIYSGPSADYQPSLDIRATKIPVDALLISALPEPSEGSVDPRQILTDLSLDGSVDCVAEIRPDASSDRDITYNIDISTNALRAQPADARIPLTDLTGWINIQPERIAISGMSAKLAEAQIALDASFELGVDQDISCSISADRIDLAAPIEQFARVFASQTADALFAVRTDHAPTGTLDALVTLEGPAKSLDYTVRFSNLVDTSFNTSMGRASLSETTGDIRLSPNTIAFDDFSAQLDIEASPAGFLTLAGDWRITPTTPDGYLTATLAGTTLDAPIIRSFTDNAGPAAQEWIARHNPRGIISIQADIASHDNTITSTTSRVSPRSLTIDIDEHTLDFPTASGWLTLADTGAQFDDLYLAADGWSTTVNGSIAIAPSPDADLELGLETRGLPESLMNVLPQAVVDTLGAIDLDVQGVLTIDGATLEVAGPHGARSTHFIADLAYSGVSIEAGVEIDQLSGIAHLDLTTGPNPEDNFFRADIAADTLRAFAVEMSDARATVSRANEHAPFLVQDVHATAHDGLLTANAVVESTPSSDAGAPARYRVDVEAIDIDLASLLEQVKPEDSESDDDSHQGERGKLDLSIAIDGTAGHPDSRRGRGLARVQGGDVLGVPGAMPLIRMSNLQLPFGEPLSFAYADFYIAADAVQVVDMQLFSESIAVVGTGSLALEDMSLDLRFHSRGRNRVPIVSDLIEGMRDEFVTAVVRGTLRDPEFTYEQFAGTRKMLDAIFSSRPSEPRTVRAQEDNEP